MITVVKLLDTLNVIFKANKNKVLVQSSVENNIAPGNVGITRKWNSSIQTLGNLQAQHFKHLMATTTNLASTDNTIGLWWCNN